MSKTVPVDVCDNAPVGVNWEIMRLGVKLGLFGVCSCCGLRWLIKKAMQRQKEQQNHPRTVIPELGRLFYSLGWMTGSGGSLSIREGDKIYVTPSGVEKEKVQPDELFVTNVRREVLESPPESKKLKQSQCAPLMMVAYQKRNPGAVFHTHSPSSVLVSMLYPGKEFRITYQQMIKGVGGRFDGELVVPIIQNSHDESEIIARMEKAVEDYPECNAVIVRRHGIYVWADNWRAAKLRCESYDYLFEMAAKMKQHGLDPTAVPLLEDVA